MHDVADGEGAALALERLDHQVAFLVDVDPSFSGLPTSRHEAACASGSIAILAAYVQFLNTGVGVDAYSVN